MIIQALFDIIFGLINLILNLLPELPNFDESLLVDFHSALQTIFSNTGLLGFFFPLDTIKILIPLVILVINFENIYKFALWVISWIKNHN